MVLTVHGSNTGGNTNPGTGNPDNDVNLPETKPSEPTTPTEPTGPDENGEYWTGYY